MITKHTAKTLTLWDGEREHVVRHADFAPMCPHDKGGIHPGVTEDWHGWLVIPDTHDPATCPLPTVTRRIVHPLTGRPRDVTFVPCVAWLQAKYGPDDQIVSVPIDGDANAQHLHWLARNNKERQEMRAVLEWLGAWRLNDDGTVPEGA